MAHFLIFYVIFAAITMTAYFADTEKWYIALGFGVIWGWIMFPIYLGWLFSKILNK